MRRRLSRLEMSAGAALALVYLLVGLRFYLDPGSVTRSAVGQALPPFTHIWNAMYVIGGAAVLAGRAGLLGAEDLGIRLLAAAWVAAMLAVLYAQGLDLAAAIYLPLLAWTLRRARELEEPARA